MGSMEDGWKRVIRELVYRSEGMGYASLQSDGELFVNVPINTFVSPSNVTLFNGLSTKVFSYGGGSLTYIGERPCRALVFSTQTLLIDGGNQSSSEITNGKNGIQCTSGIQHSSSAFNGEILQHSECAFDLVNGDTLDVFMNQTSAVGGADIELLHGTYHVLITDVF